MNPSAIRVFCKLLIIRSCEFAILVFVLCPSKPRARSRSLPFPRIPIMPTFRIRWHGTLTRDTSSSNGHTPARAARSAPHSQLLIFYSASRTALGRTSRAVRRVRIPHTRQLIPRPNRQHDLRSARCPIPPRHLFGWDACIVRQPFPVLGSPVLRWLRLYTDLP